MSESRKEAIAIVVGVMVVVAAIFGILGIVRSRDNGTETVQFTDNVAPPSPMVRGLTVSRNIGSFTDLVEVRVNGTTRLSVTSGGDQVYVYDPAVGICVRGATGTIDCASAEVVWKAIMAIQRGDK